MPAAHAFDHAFIRVVPHVEREEFINVGVILYCPALHFLDTRIHLDVGRLIALAPDVDVAMVEEQLAVIPAICAGGVAAGPIGLLSQAERFHWLVAPRSTTIQMSPVHCGELTDPQTELDDLFEKMVK